MSGKAPAFQFYPKDWLSDMAVLGMSAEERGAYIMLLCIDWNEGGLPDDTKALAAVCKVDEDVISTLVQRVFNECLTERGTDVQRATNARLQRERESQEERRKQQQKAGKASAEKRKNKGKNKQNQQVFNERSTPVEQACNSSPSPSSSSSSSSSSNKERKSTKENASPDTASKLALAPEGARISLNGSKSDQSISSEIDIKASDVRSESVSGGEQYDLTRKRSNDVTAKPKGKSVKKRFVPPTHQELAELFRDRGLGIADAETQAEQFLNFYESNGWKVGKNKMVSWRHAAANWSNRNKDRNGNNRENYGSRARGTHVDEEAIEHFRQLDAGEGPF